MTFQQKCSSLSQIMILIYRNDYIFVFLSKMTMLYLWPKVSALCCFHVNLEKDMWIQKRLTTSLTSWLLLTSPFNSFHSASVSLHKLTVNSMHLIFIVYCASTTYSSWGRGVVLLNNIMTTILKKHNLLYETLYMFYIVIQNCILCVLNAIGWHLCQRQFWLSLQMSP